MIELAPTSKRGLGLRGPLIVAAGGYGQEFEPALLKYAHALITLPTSLRPCLPPRGLVRVAEFPGGFLIQRAGVNPGLAAVLQAQRHAWRRLTVPLILALASEDARHWSEIARRAARVEAVSALQLEIAEDVEARQAVGAVRAECDLPLLALLPLERTVELAEAALEGGADALVVGLAPRGLAGFGQELWEGRLAGPVVKPLALRAVRRAAERYPETPLIGAGGVYSAQDVRDLMQAGARAVEIDTALWRQPKALVEIANRFALLNPARS